MSVLLGNEPGVLSLYNRLREQPVNRMPASPFAGLQSWPMPLRTGKSEDKRLLQLSLEYRVLYYFKLFPVRSFLAFQGACWCSRDKIGTFPYGPSPTDPSLSSTVIRSFLTCHEETLCRLQPVGHKLDLEDEQELNRQCLVLGLFETIIHKGLYNCHDLPLFRREIHTKEELLRAVPNDWVLKLTHLSFSFYYDYREVDVDILGLVRHKKFLPLDSPLKRVYESINI